MPKYLIKATVLFHYEIEAKDHREAVMEGYDPTNLETQEFLRDIMEVEATELDDTWEGLDSVPNPKG
jgi:hypothetical protein